MAIKTDLKVVLYAGDVTVAESDDSELWQNILAAITKDESWLPGEPAEENFREGSGSPGSMSNGDTDPIIAFADDLDIDPAFVKGACAPTEYEPFLHLDPHAWESFRNNTPARGRGAIAPAALAGTLLVLWSMYADIPTPSTSHINDVLDTVAVRDKNPSRGLKNCEWIQVRGDGLYVNPAKISKAKAVARAFCTQQPISER